MNYWERIEQSTFFTKNPNLFEFLKFAVVGVIGTIVDFGFYTLLSRGFGMYYLYARAISVLLAIGNNFFFNKYWTFKRGKSGRTKLESVKFFIVSILNYFLNLGIMYVIVEYTSAEQLFGVYEDYFAILVAIGIVLFSNYFANKFWTFKLHDESHSTQE